MYFFQSFVFPPKNSEKMDDYLKIEKIGEGKFNLSLCFYSVFEMCRPFVLADWCYHLAFLSVCLSEFVSRRSHWYFVFSVDI